MNLVVWVPGEQYIVKAHAALTKALPHDVIVQQLSQNSSDKKKVKDRMEGTNQHIVTLTTVVDDAVQCGLASRRP